MDNKYGITSTSNAFENPSLLIAYAIRLNMHHKINVGMSAMTAAITILNMSVI